MKRALFVLLVLLSLAAGAQDPLRSLSELANKPQAPVFSLHDLDDKLHNLRDYAGKPVVINFWATWCPPCRREMPSMQRAWEQLQDENIAMLAINVGETEDKVFAFTGDYPVDFPILFDTDSTVLKAWPVRGLPTTFVLDPQGRIIYRAIGGREWDDPELLRKIKDLSP